MHGCVAECGDRRALPLGEKMPNLSEWLESCFNENDHRAPIRAFVFGALIASIAATISSLAVDPRDMKMLASLFAGAVFFGGGCGAMFALPTEKFRHLFLIGFDLFSFLPLKVVFGIGLFPFVLFASSMFVAILAAIATLQVVYLAMGLAIRWFLSVFGPTPNTR